MSSHASIQPQPSGILLIDKPAGITSFDIIRHLRRQTKVRKFGHAGTLDPMATGLMIILVGDACKQAERYSKLDKSYLGTITLGANSSTGDAEGKLTRVSTKHPSQVEVMQAIQSHIGEIEQTPPVYSAIKIDGQEAYKRARRGESIEMPSRQVNIHKLHLLDYDYPKLYIDAHVSSGTYIRTLAETIGKQLHTGGHLSALRRMSIGSYSVADAHELKSITAENLSAKLSIIDPLQI